MIKIQIEVELDEDATKEDGDEIAEGMLYDIKFYDPEEDGQDLREHITKYSYRVGHWKEIK